MCWTAGPSQPSDLHPAGLENHQEGQRLQGTGRLLRRDYGALAVGWSFGLNVSEVAVGMSGVSAAMRGPGKEASDCPRLRCGRQLAAKATPAPLPSARRSHAFQHSRSYPAQVRVCFPPFRPFNQPTTEPSRLPRWECSTCVLPTSLCRARPRNHTTKRRFSATCGIIPVYANIGMIYTGRQPSAA